MFVSMNWIGDFVDLSGLDRKALIARFTLSTAEVEDIYEKGADTYGVVVARVLSVEPHPDSQKLHLLKIDVGAKEPIDCVCGAPNVRPGLTVAFAREGGCVCGHPIGAAKVAGYMSYGMCCSEAELGISADNSGLMELPDDLPLGRDLKQIYDIDDIIFEVDNKSLTNRPDLWGHYGIAREFATLTGRPLKKPDCHPTAAYDGLPEVDVTVSDPELCLRYCAIKAEGITRRKSPVNMRIRLFYCGSRAINFLADLTNYVMMELGQPMHAFDLRRVQSVDVRRLPEETPFTTLDGTQRKIDTSTLMITSEGKPVAIAGIMGGLDSEIEDDTTSLLLESACFNAVSVRRSSTRLGLRTDASMRYEKTLDPELTVTAAQRLLHLLLTLDPDARVTSRLTDRYPTKFPTIELDIDKPFVDRYTGIDISSDEIEKTLRALEFGVVRTGDNFHVTVPSFRATKDVTIKADLIEEITRIYGYDNFAVKTTKSPLYPVRPETGKTDETEIKDLLVKSAGLHEVHSYIWSDLAKDKALGIETPDNVRLLNAQTPDHAILRRSMIPTLLSFARENKGYGDAFGLFEIGHTVEGKLPDGTCDERKRLGVVLYDKTASEESVFLRLRDLAVLLTSQLRHLVPDFAHLTPAYNWQHPVNSFSVSAAGSVIGCVGVLHPAVKEKLDKKAAVAWLEIDMAAFAAVPAQPLHYRAPSRFPAIDIDLSFAADLASLDFGRISEAVRRAGGEWLADIGVLDTYEGESGQWLTLRLTFSSGERTLSKAELAPVTDEIIRALSPLGMTFRAV